MPLPCFSSLAHHRLDHIFGLVQLEVAQVDIGREDCDIALAEIGNGLRRMLQVREAEERRDLPAFRGHVHRADAHLDFLFGLFDILGVGVPGQILVRPGMRPDRHAGIDHLPGDLGMPSRVLADFEEGRLQTFVSQRLEHGRRVARPGTVVEGQNDFLVTKEVILLEMLEAEAGAAGGIDFDNAREPHTAGFVACGNCIGRRCGLGLSRSVRRRRARSRRRRTLRRLRHRRVGAATAAGAASAPAWATWLTG